MILEARGRLALSRGEHRVALGDFLASAELVRGSSAVAPGVFCWRQLAAIAAAALGERDRAGAWIEEELEAVREHHSARVRACALRAAGIVRGGEEGLALLLESIELRGDSPARLERAHSLLELGAALRRSGKRTQSRERLRTALDLALEMGAAPLAERAREELRASGARLRRERSSGLAALTPSERRIARLAVRGYSVPEIARQLTLSRKTVEWHLGHTYAELEVHSREELNAAWEATSSA